VSKKGAAPKECCPKGLPQRKSTGCPKGRSKGHPQQAPRQEPQQEPQRKTNGCPKGIFSIGLSILSNIGVHKGCCPKEGCPKGNKWLPERNFLDRVVNIEQYWCPQRVLPQRGLPQRKRNGYPKGIFSMGLSILSNIGVHKGCCPKEGCPKGNKWLPERNFLGRVVNIEPHWCPQRVLPQRGLPQRKQNGCPKGIFSIGLSILSNIGVHKGCCPKEGCPKGNEMAARKEFSRWGCQY
jgi:DNA-directed RNA polymerase subunit N (RpoN/RPB10)